VKRTINNSGLTRILFEDFSLEIAKTPSDREISIQIKWDLQYLNLSKSADVTLELASRGVSIRVALGKFGDGQGTFSDQLKVGEETPTLRAELYVSEWQSGIKRIIASAAPVVIVIGQHSGASNPLLPVKLVQQLEVLWRLDCSSGKPTLEVSNQVQGAVSQGWFIASVLPQVVREVFITIALDRADLDNEPAQEWERVFIGLGMDSSFLQNKPDGEVDYGVFVNDTLEIGDRLAESFTRDFGLLKIANGEMHSGVEG
jgi:hypothetical protein